MTRDQHLEIAAKSIVGTIHNMTRACGNQESWGLSIVNILKHLVDAIDRTPEQDTREQVNSILNAAQTRLNELKGKS